MNALEQYGIFLLEVITIVIAILTILAFLFSKAQQSKLKAEKGELKVTKINDDFTDLKETLQQAMLDKHQLKAFFKSKKAEQKKEDKVQRKKETAPQKKRLFVIDFYGDIKASAVQTLREEVTAILFTATTDDEILMRLESPGGIVNAYGLAASQLHRIRTAKIPLTVAIDKVAASGGYMMASVANHIIAAPFAIVGSIGVVAQLPNFNRWLKQHHVDYEQITAGEYKRTLTFFGENDAKGRQKMQADVEQTHELFKSFIHAHREQVNLEQVATGEYWYGQQAIELKLVDAIQTSDDYLVKANENCEIYHVAYHFKVPAVKKLFKKVETKFLSAYHALGTGTCTK